MRKVQCGECGKSYDYDEDGFCPRCGAFNQPSKSIHINADGSVVRVDGLNESNHAGSFVHRELHEENRERRGSGLSKGVRRAPGGTSASTRSSSSQRSMPRWKAKEKGTPNRGLVIALAWIFLIIAINFLGGLTSLFF